MAMRGKAAQISSDEETRSTIAGARVVLVKYEQGLDQISDGVFPHSRSSSCPCPYIFF
jgi:hypothetical protein